MIYITPSSDSSRHYDIIVYKGPDTTVYVTQQEFNSILEQRNYHRLDLNSSSRKHMVKDYIQDYPDCIHKNHPLRDQMDKKFFKQNLKVEEA
jgi:hypothetical protein